MRPLSGELIGFMKTLAMELGAYSVRANAILPGSVDGERFQRVLEQRAQAAGKSVAEMHAIAISNQSLKCLVDPSAIAALTLFLAFDATRSISNQEFPIDGDMQRNRLFE